MNADLRDLYQEVVVDHGRHPRNFRRMEDATRTIEGINPLCGDQLIIYVKLQLEVLCDLAFQGSGCAISKASASLMTAALKGKKREEAIVLFGRVHDMLVQGPPDPLKTEHLGKLAVLSGVWQFPARVKCASLAWHALKSALENTGAARVSTE